MYWFFVDGCGGVAAVVVLIAVIRTVRWCYLSSQSQDVDWDVGSGGRLFAPVADVLWYYALFDPERLARSASELAQSWARRRAVKTLLRRFQDIAHWLRSGIWHPHVLSAVHHTHVEAAFALADSLSGIGPAAGDLHDHLAAWMCHVPSESRTAGTDLAVPQAADGAGYATDGTGYATDAAGAVGAMTVLTVARHGFKVYTGDKTFAEAAADASVEVAVKWAGGFLVLTVVQAAVDSLAPGVGTVAVGLGRWLAAAGMKHGRQAELRSLKKTLQDRVRDVGAELYAVGRRDKLRKLIWEPCWRSQQAVAALSQEVRRIRREIAYWVWPSPHQVIYVQAKRRGTRAEIASWRRAEAMSLNLAHIDQSPNRHVLAGKVLIRSPRLQAELGVPAHLVRQAKMAHDDVLAEAGRLHRRYGY